jgi:hypothetical protein
MLGYSFPWFLKRVTWMGRLEWVKFGGEPRVARYAAIAWFGETAQATSMGRV